MRRKIINDKSISFKATGLFLCILDIIENKGSCTTSDIKNFRNGENNSRVEGTTAITTGINELLEHGYLTRSQVNRNGRISEYIYQLPETREEVDLLDNIPVDFHKFQKLWEQTIGILSASTGMWLLKVANKMPYEVFEEAIFEADARGSKTYKYVKGIIDNWLSINIKDEEALNKARADRNSKFEEAQLEKVKKSSGNYNGNVTPINKYTKIKKTSEIQAEKELIDFVRSKSYGQKGVGINGKHQQEIRGTEKKIHNRAERLAEIRRRGK